MRIYHNPNCGTSRAVLARIREAGVEPEVIEYLEDAPGSRAPRRASGQAGPKPRDVLRRKGTTLETLGRDEAKMSDEEVLTTIVAHPILLERPIVVVGEDARICRPAERVDRFLNAASR